MFHHILIAYRAKTYLTASRKRKSTEFKYFLNVKVEVKWKKKLSYSRNVKKKVERKKINFTFLSSFLSPATLNRFLNCSKRFSGFFTLTSNLWSLPRLFSFKKNCFPRALTTSQHHYRSTLTVTHSLSLRQNTFRAVCFV